MSHQLLTLKSPYQPDITNLNLIPYHSTCEYVLLVSLIFGYTIYVTFDPLLDRPELACKLISDVVV